MDDITLDCSRDGRAGWRRRRASTGQQEVKKSRQSPEAELGIHGPVKVTARRVGSTGRAEIEAGLMSRLIVAVEQSTETAEDRSFTHALAANAGRGRDDAIRHPAEGQGLQPDAARPPQRGEEQTLAAEQG